MKPKSSLLLLPSACVFALLFIMACANVPIAAQGGASFFVAPDGNDNNPGTIDRPWRTLAKANKTLDAGDIVFIRQGEYDDYIDPQNSGEPGRKITYSAYNGETVTLRGKPGVAKLVAIRRSYIVVDGLKLSYAHSAPGGNKRWAWVFMRGSDAHHNEIRNCLIVRDGDPLELNQNGYNEFAIVLSGSAHNKVENNTIRGLNQGVHISDGAQHNLIQFNRISETIESAIVVGSSRGVFMGNLIQYNTLESSATEDGIQFMQNSEAPDPSTDISNFGTIVRNNVIRYNAENAIDLKGAAYVVIEGNIIYGTMGSNNGPVDNWNRNSMYAIGRGANANASDVIIRYNVIYDNPCGVWMYDRFKVYNNTIVYNNRDYTGNSGANRSNSSPDFCGVFERKYGSAKLAVKNNILGGHQDGQAVLRIGNQSDADVDNNLYFDLRRAGNVDFDTAGQWQEFSLNDWQQHLAGEGHIVGQDRQSRVAEPLFRHVPADLAGDHDQFSFFLNDDSPAIDGGAPLTHVLGSGSGNRIPVDDAGYFYNGYGISRGDTIQVGASPWVTIVDIDYGKNELVVDQAITWQDEDPVNLPYGGNGPDIGAHEYYELNYHTYLPLIEH